MFTLTTVRFQVKADWPGGLSASETTTVTVWSPSSVKSGVWTNWSAFSPTTRTPSSHHSMERGKGPSSSTYRLNRTVWFSSTPTSASSGSGNSTGGRFGTPDVEKLHVTSPGR